MSATALTALSAGSAAAQTWTGATSNDWTVGSNWSGGAAPVAGGSAVINTNSPNPAVLGVGGAVAGTSGLITVGDTTGSFGNLTIQNGSTLTTSGGATIEIGSDAGSNGTVTVTGAGSQVTTTNIQVGNRGNGTLNIQNGAEVIAHGAVDLGDLAGGTGTLNISGGSTLETTFLAKGASGTGQVNFDNAILRGTAFSVIGLLSGFSPGDLNIAAGGLTIDTRAFAVGEDSGLSGVGGLTKIGTGTLFFQGNNTFTGETVIKEGTFVLQNSGTLATSSRVVADGIFNISLITGAASNIQSLAGTGTVTLGAKNLTITNANDTFAGVITGTGGLTISGGTQTLSGVNTYTGGTTISAGTLQLGNGGASGSIVGDVTNNGTLAFNRSDTSTFGGIVSGTGSLTQVGAGTTILTGTNTYSGGTTISRGTLSVSSDTNLGAATGTLNFNTGGILQVTGTSFTGTTRAIDLGSGGGGFDIANAANTFTLGQAITGNGSLFKLGAGTLTLTGDSSLTGGVAILAGTLQLGNGGSTGSFLGQVVNNGTFAINRSDTVAFSGPISGSGVFEQRGTGTTILTGNNTYAGGTLISGGTLIGQVASFGTGGISNNAALVFNQPADATFAGVISGSGTLTKRGAGSLNLTGTGSMNGATTVETGKLSVNGSLANSSVSVLIGATIGGIGTIGGLSVASGGIAAPGNSIGTLNVSGNVSFAAGSFYQVEANAAGQSDKILATGNATLGGGSVLALAQAGTYAPQTIYTILTANTGVNGRFADVSSNLTFLTPTLTYDLNNVYLTFTRSSTTFPDVAETPNQRAVSNALQVSPQTDPLVISILNQSAAGARQAFDALSGEVHASAQTAMLDDSRYLRDAVLGRLRQSSFAGGTGPMAALGMGGPDVAAMDSLATSSALAYASTERRGFPIKAPPLATPARIPETTFWAQGVGAWGRYDGNGNAAGMTRNLAGFFSGVDHRFAPNWLAGLAGGYTSSSVRVGDRGSSADIQTAHLAGYVGASYGALNLRGGAGASFSTLDTSRSVIFPNFADSTRARYDATTAQVFGEVGYGFNLGQIALEPFGGLAWAHVGTNSFNETGGNAALIGFGNSQDVGYSTIGARFATNWVIDNGMLLTPRASVSWQHAFGDITPTAALAFRGLGTAFTTAGVPLARNAALVEGGLDLRVSSQASVGVSYVGQIADRVQDHSVKGSFSWRF